MCVYLQVCYSFDCNSCFICSFIAKNESFGRPPLSPLLTHLSLSRLSPFTVLVSLSGSGCCCSYYSTSLSLPSLYLPPPAILVATLMCCLSNQRVTDADAVPVFPKKIDYPPPPSVPCCRLLAVTRLTKLRSSARDSEGSRGREGEGKWLSGVMLYGMFDQSFWYSGIFCSISI